MLNPKLKLKLNPENITNSIKPLSKLKKILLFVFSVSLAYYVFFYLEWFLFVSNNVGNEGFGSILIIPSLVITSFMVSIISVFFFYFLSKKIVEHLSNPKWMSFIMWANILYISITIFFNIFPGAPMFSHIQITTEPQYHVGDSLSYQVTAEKGTVLFHSIYTSLTLHKPDGTKINDTETIHFDANQYSPNCHVALITIFCSYAKDTYYFQPIPDIGIQSGTYVADNFPITFSGGQFSQLGTYELSDSSGILKSAIFEVVSPKTSTAISYIPGYYIYRLDSTPNLDDLPPDADFGISYHKSDGGDPVWVSRENASQLDNTISQLRQSGTLTSINGNKIFIRKSSKKDGSLVIDKAYWTNHSKLITILVSYMYWLPGPVNVLDSEIFKEYIKKYPSDL